VTGSVSAMSEAYPLARVSAHPARQREHCATTHDEE
jgi:hypothetical protein